MEKDQLSIKTKTFWIWITIVILVASASFATGYLYRGQDQHAPIIIEKNSGNIDALR